MNDIGEVEPVAKLDDVDAHRAVATGAARRLDGGSVELARVVVMGAHSDSGDVVDGGDSRRRVASPRGMVDNGTSSA